MEVSISETGLCGRVGVVEEFIDPRKLALPQNVIEQWVCLQLLKHFVYIAGGLACISICAAAGEHD